MNKLSFKKGSINTGLYSVVCPRNNTDIKLNKKRFGYINLPNHNSPYYTVSICIEKDKNHDDGNSNCSWMWIFFKKTFDTEMEAREFVESRISKWIELYTLHFFDE